MSDVFIHLVRHGETDWNAQNRLHGHSDSVLSDLGTRQALALSHSIRSLNIDAVYSSTSVRATQTAEIIMQSLSSECKICLSPLLKEIDLGPLEGMYLEQAAESYPKEYQDFFSNPDQFLLCGAETFFELQSRAVSFVKGIVNSHINESVLLVTHCAFIKTLLAFFEPRHLSNLWQSPQLLNCSHSILHFVSDDEVIILQYTNASTIS